MRISSVRGELFGGARQNGGGTASSATAEARVPRTRGGWIRFQGSLFFEATVMYFVVLGAGFPSSI